MQKFIFHIAIILFLLTGCGTSSSLNEPATLQFAKHNGKIVFNFGKTETNDQVLARFHDLREEENMTIENKQNEPIVKATKNVNAEQQTEERKDKSNPITNEHNQHNQNQIENRQENSKNKHVVQERNAEKNNQQPIQESRLGQIIIKHLPNTHSEPRVEDPTHIVLHFSSNVVNNTEDPYRINDIYYIFLDYNVSTHYVIDRDGNIYQFVDENRVAWHAGKGSLPGLKEYTNRLNHYSIGIELLAIGSEAEMQKMVPQVDYHKIPKQHIGYTDAQYKSLTILIKDIIQRNPTIKFNRNKIIGHDEYTMRKVDPGELFEWSKIGL